MEHLSDYILWTLIMNNIDPDEKVHCQNHISECRECHLKYHQFLQLHSRLKELSVYAPSNTFSSDVIQKIIHSPHRPKSFSLTFFPALVITSVFLTAFILGYVITHTQQPLTISGSVFSSSVISFIVTVLVLVFIDRLFALDSSKIP